MADKQKTGKNKQNRNSIITRVIFRDKGPNSDEPKLPAVRRLLKETVGLIARYRGLFAMLALSYLVANWLLVAFPLSSTYGDTKELLDSSLEQGLDGALGVGTLTLGGLSGMFTAPQSQSGQLISSIIMLLFVLGVIFAARHLLARQEDDEEPEVGLRDVLYNSPTPFISFIFVMFIAVLAAMPGALGAFVIPYVISLEEPWWAEAIFIVIGLSLIGLSVFWLLRLLFALFIVTLPGSRPWESIKEAKGLVAGRRWSILWRLLVFGLLALVAWVVLLIPFVLIDLQANVSWLPLVPMAIGAINALLVTACTVYTYKLYRALL